MKKILAILLTLTMIIGLGVSTFAQTVAYTGTDGDGAKITITNAAKGETYKIAKLFDATVTGADGGSIAYSGEIPEALAAYFVADSAGNISATDALDLTSNDVQAALKSWAEANVTAQADSDGSELEFTNLPYGYYIITTTQGETLLTVDSTNPNAEVIDKNTTPPVGGLEKKVNEEGEVVSVGDTVTYTVTFTTASYDDEGNQIDKYTIEDTLPDFLEDVTVTSIIIDDDADSTTTDDQTDVTTQFTDKKIELTWAEDGTNLYANGASITIVYTAKVTDKIAAGNVDTNANKVTVTPSSGDTTVEGDETTETIQTYAAAIQKVDENGADLAGATFQVPGLTVTGSAGNYTVVSYDPTSTAAGTTMECDGNGFLVIRGISNETTITVYEVDAPDGYNKLTDGVTLPVVKTSETTTVTSTTTTIYYDSEGNVVSEETEGGSSETTTEVTTNDDLVAGALEIENNKGTELPSTGGIGTTIFYVVGGLLAVGAGVVLVTKKRMGKEEL